MVKYFFVKRIFFSYILTIFLLTIFFISLIYIIIPSYYKSSVVSPLPPFLTLYKNNQVSSLNLWIPIIRQIRNLSLQKPNLSAKSALVYDMTSNSVLFEKNSTERLPMASITKIMTAIIAIENKKADDEYLVTKDALVGENSMGLTEGEVMRLEDLLYGLILPSGNDAAETLAQNYPKRRKAFIDAMNNKAKALGLTNTHFTNPSGLEGDGDQYTTAYDLLVITKYAMNNFPLFRKVVSTVSQEIPQTKTHKYFYLENETNLLTSYPGVKGIKTGFTDEANLCLVTYLDYKGHQIIGIILGSNNRREEMKELLDYSLKSLGIKPPPHQ